MSAAQPNQHSFLCEEFSAAGVSVGVSGECQGFETLPYLLQSGADSREAPGDLWSGTCTGLLDLKQVPYTEFPRLRHANTQIVLQNSPAVVPLDHLIDIIDEVLFMGRQVHCQPTELGSLCSGRLIVGSKGIGKSTMLKALAKPGVLHEMLRASYDAVRPAAAFDTTVNITVVIYRDMRTEGSLEDSSSFTDWVLASLLRAEASGGTLVFPEGSESRKRLVQEWPNQQYEDHRRSGMVGIASTLLRHLGIRVVCLLDEIEHLYSDKIYSAESVQKWFSQLYGIDAVTHCTVAIVLCASLQRARQMFLLAPDEEPHSFCGRFKHAERYATNWNRSKFKACFIESPCWTPFLLSWFMLHCATQHEVDSKRHRQIAQQMDEDLAAISVEAWKGSIDEMSHSSHVQYGMKCTLEAFGDSPREIRSTIVHEQFKKRSECAGRFTKWDVSEKALPAVRVILELLAEAGTIANIFSDSRASEAKRSVEPTPSPYVFGFAPSQLQIDFRVFMARVCSSYQSNASEGGQSAHSWAKQTVNAAMDGDYLREIRASWPNGDVIRAVQLCSPTTIWKAYAPLVHPNIVDWFRYPGFGERRELPVARALVRLANAHDKGLLTPRARGFSDFMCCDGSANVLVDNDSKLVSQNSVAFSGTLAALRLVTPATATAADISCTFPQCLNWSAAKLASLGPLQQSGVSEDMYDSILGAYLSVHRMHDSLVDLLRVRQDATYWLKESPDSAGGDLVGIKLQYLVTASGCSLRMGVVRAQVKTGEQSTLALGRGSKQSGNAMNTSVLGFCGNSAATATAADVRAAHDPVADAICGCIIAGILGKGLDLRGFALAFCQMRSSTELKSLPCVVTTHAPPASSVSHLNRACIHLLDAWDLRHSWGELGELGYTHGIRPFCNPPRPEIDLLQQGDADIPSSLPRSAGEQFVQQCLAAAAKQSRALSAAALLSNQPPTGQGKKRVRSAAITGDALQTPKQPRVD